MILPLTEAVGFTPGTTVCLPDTKPKSTPLSNSWSSSAT
jgi:hypothetical protein